MRKALQRGCSIQNPIIYTTTTTTLQQPQASHFPVMVRRAPSPTPTAFSGISNYRTDSYRPIRDPTNVPAVPAIDYRQVSKSHFLELSTYLASYLAQCLLTSLSFPPTHLISTLKQHHQTRVPQLDKSSLVSPSSNSTNSLQTYMMSFFVERMRIKVAIRFVVGLCSRVPLYFVPDSTYLFLIPVPFLPVREEFHPKRNQARQKLATLPTSRFEDLSSDVYFELLRRYPEFKEEVCP